MCAVTLMAQALKDSRQYEWNNDPNIKELYTYNRKPQFVQGKWRFFPRHTHKLLRAALYKLIRSHDYEAAVKTLSVYYLYFKLSPLECVQLSLEIMNQQESSAEHVLHYFEALQEASIKDNHIKISLLHKETLLVFMQYGRYREAYFYFQDRIKQERFKDDVELLGTYGILCYWYFATENRDFLAAIKESSMDEEEFITPSQSISNHAVFQSALEYLKRALDLSKNMINVRFLEYYAQVNIYCI